VILPGHEQDDHTEVVCGIAGWRAGTHLPVAPDLQCHVARGPVADVGEGHDDDFAARFLAHVRDDAFHARDRRRVDHPGEIVDIATRRRDLDLHKQK